MDIIKQFEQAYDNFLAGVDIDTTMLDCAEFMFNAGRESVSKQAEPVALDVGNLEYMGNSVSFIYQKMRAYRDGMGKVWQALRDNGIHPDGQTHAADAIRKALAQPAQPVQPAVAVNEQMRTALEGLLAITRDSQGVAGYHLNGVVAKWDEFEEVSAAEAAITAAEAEAANHIEPTLEKVSAVAVNGQLLRAAKKYFTRYCRDEAAEFGPDDTGCSQEQHQDALELREAIAEAEKAKGGAA